MAFPTTILRAPVVGLHGQVADMSNAEFKSGVCQNANILAGCAVSWVATPDDAVRVGAVAQASPFLVGPSFKGIAILDTTRELNGTASNPYLVGDAVTIMTKGTMWISVSGAVAETDPVSCDTTTGVIGNTAPDATHARLPAVWETSTSGAGIARIRLNSPTSAI